MKYVGLDLAAQDHGEPSLLSGLGLNFLRELLRVGWRIEEEALSLGMLKFSNRGNVKASDSLSEEQDVRIDRRPILVVDDNPLCVQVSAGLLECLGYVAETAVSGEEALRRFDPERHTLVLTDYEMGSVSGVELARLVKQQSPATPVILCSGRPPEQAGASDVVLAKPLCLETLRGALAQLSGARA